VPIDHVIGGLTDIAERMAAASGRTYHLVSGAPVPVAALRDRSRCPRCHGRRRERPAGDRATAAAAAKAPSLLVDLRRVPGLGNIAVGESGVRLGARVRWRDIEHDRRLATAHPLLREAVAHVAHYQIRNRGTVGGSLAHADPAVCPGISCIRDQPVDRPALDLVGRPRSLISGGLARGRVQLLPSSLVKHLCLAEQVGAAGQTVRLWRTR
jgi:hypothetical protein